MFEALLAIAPHSHRKADAMSWGQGQIKTDGSLLSIGFYLGEAFTLYAMTASVKTMAMRGCDSKLI